LPPAEFGTPAHIIGMTFKPAGRGYAGIHRRFIVACYYASWESSPREEGRTLWATTRGGGLERMNRRGLWAAGVVGILLVVGAGVLTVGTGYAKDED
jgi:hypothetical protein